MRETYDFSLISRRAEMRRIMMKSGLRRKTDGKLNVISLIISLIALLATVWIIVPAPSYYIWLFSVLASEWSLGFGVLALAGIFFAILARMKNGGRIWTLSFVMGASALFISLYPLVSALSAARNQNISLSWCEYFSGFRRDNSEINYATRTFTEIEGQELKLDVYLPPAGTEKNGAGVIVVHGGSWNGGRRNDFPQWNAWLARQGFAVFDIDYRLAPQPNGQTATGDVKCAAAWVRQNAAEFGIAPDRIALLGRSAGAQLALLAAYSENNPQFPSSCADKEIPITTTLSGKKIRAVISLYAPTDLIWSYDHPANEAVIDGRDTLRRFLGGNPHESEEMENRFLASSPVANVSAQTPPTLLIHGGEDQLVKFENMNLLAAKLRDNGVLHQEIFISYAQHGFDYNFDGWGAQVIKPQILEFLRENTK